MQDKRELYKKEILSTLDQLWKDNGQIKGFRYFADIAYKFYLLDTSAELCPDVVVLGTGIPEALLRASPVRYRYLLGGSHTMTTLSDELVPRDTDPVSRSILGAICASSAGHTQGANHVPSVDHAPRADNTPVGMRFNRSLFLIPISSDSMRKIAYLLKEDGYKTFTLDVPPVHSDPRSIARWETQLLRMMDAVVEHTHKRISLRRIRKAVRSVTLARYRLDEFLHETDPADGCPVITGAGKMLIQNSYYYADDLEAWGSHLKELQREIRHLQSPRRTTDDRPKILLTGSPVFFPNYKIPFLIEDVGLSIQEHIDESTVRQAALLSPKTLRTTKQAVHAIADSTFRHEASAAFTSNDALMAAVGRALRSGQIEGIVFHILKGQIEYDFEMARMEEMFEYYDIPVFRLETDYQDHDIEQLRIRLEAFREMLSQARYSMQTLRRSS